MKSFTEFLEDNKDALKRALAMHKFKRGGGKVEKQPPSLAIKGSGSYGGRGKGALKPMGKEDKKMIKDLQDYRKKMNKGRKKKRTGRSSTTQFYNSGSQYKI